MTTYAPNYTPRLKVHYRAGGLDHSIQVRNARGTSFGDMQFMVGRIHDLFLPLATVLYTDFAFVSTEIALTDDDVFVPASNPVAVTGTGPVYTTKSIMARIRALTFSGKASGSRAVFRMFGIFLATDTSTDVAADGKITGIESGPVATIAALATANFRAGSGGAAIFPAVATYKENDHLLRLARKGAIS